VQCPVTLNKNKSACRVCKIRSQELVFVGIFVDEGHHFFKFFGLIGHFTLESHVESANNRRWFCCIFIFNLSIRRDSMARVLFLNRWAKIIFIILVSTTRLGRLNNSRWICCIFFDLCIRRDSMARILFLNRWAKIIFIILVSTARLGRLNFFIINTFINLRFWQFGIILRYHNSS